MTYSIFIRDVGTRKEELFEKYKTGLKYFLFKRIAEIESFYPGRAIEVIARLPDGTQVFDT